MADTKISALTDGAPAQSADIIPVARSGTPRRLTLANVLALVASTAQTWSAIQTFVNSKLKLLGSSTGVTTFTSANSGATDYTITVPAVNSTLLVASDIGASVQAYDADLMTWAGVTPGTGVTTALGNTAGASGGVATFDQLGSAAFTASTAYDVAGAAAAVTPTTLGLVVGTNVQAYDADLTTWAGVTPGTDVATALAVNVGTAGAVVVQGGALGTPSSGTLTSCSGLPAAGVANTALTLTDTQTATNKRVTPRVVSATNYTTDTGSSLNGDTTDIFLVTAQAGALKFNNPSGTPTDGQVLWLAVTGTAARALTWDTAYEASTIALPTTTVTTNRLDMAFIWNVATSKWRIVGQA